MRLTEKEIIWIRETIHQIDPAAIVRLFGSRTKDNTRGGDIDLLILSEILGLREKLIIRYRLKEKLGNRKIDLIVTPKPQNEFTRYALKHSLLL